MNLQTQNLKSESGHFISTFPEWQELLQLVDESINHFTFAKLTLTKTIGDTDLRNVYMRPLVQNGELFYALLERHKSIETELLLNREAAYEQLAGYMNKPFLQAILFTLEQDYTLKLNKKRMATLILSEPTFKNPADSILEWQLICKAQK